MNRNRATLKVEIPFTDHAHCIGRQGNQIQTIMSTTDTQIHFPDENRQPNRTKSNQVSISGTIPSIDRARKAIREILPLSLKFLIPSSHWIDLINDDYPLFRYVRSKFDVVVLPRPYAKTNEVFCVVRGRINQPDVAEATEHLLKVFYGVDAHRIAVTCQTEVSEQYHHYLQTRQQSKEMSIEAIERYTQTNIEFRRTSVTISGSASRVCQARKLFDFCLPILLTFEMPVDKDLSREQIDEINEKFNVVVVVRTRKDKSNKFVVLQTQEFNCEELFNVRSSILNGFSSSRKLFSFLRSKNLEKYSSIFDRHEIDFEKFLQMTENDLKKIGIETFGARRRMSQAIGEMKNSFCFFYK